MKKRLLSLTLCCLMIFTMLPVQAFADDEARSIRVYNDNGIPKAELTLDSESTTDLLVDYFVITEAAHEYMVNASGAEYIELGLQGILDAVANGDISSESVIAQVDDATFEGGQTKKSFELTGLTANGKFFICMYITTAQTAGALPTALIETDANGLIKMPQCVITWKMNDGTEDTYGETTSVDQGGKITLPATDPTRAGYKFNGWFTANSDGNKVTAETTAPTAATVTYFAQWTPKTTTTADMFEVDGTYTYNGAAQTVKIKVKEANKNGMGAVSITDGGTQTNASDSYTVTFNVAEGDEYAAATGLTLTWAIGKATMSISADPNTASVTVTDNVDISSQFKVKDADGNDVDASKYSISYGSGSESNATVDSGGVVTGVAQGSAVITATLSNSDDTNYTVGTNTANVTVTVNAATTNTVNAGSDKTVTYGDESFTQAATVTAGTPKYTSSNTGVATVNESTGAVTIVGQGTATITATVEAGKYGGTVYAEGSDSYTLTVNKKTLTVTDGSYAVTKVYDGNTNAGTATGALGLSGAVSGDAVSLQTGYTPGTYADANAADNKTITVSNISLTGEKSDNYTVAATYSFTKAAITKKAVTLSTTASKTYDTNDTVKVADLAKASFDNNDNSAIISGDTITVSSLNGTKYSSADVHRETALSAQGTPAFTGADNYDVTFTITTGAITKADQSALTVNAKPTDNTMVYGDTFTLTTSGGSSNGAVTWAVSSDNQDYATISEAGLVTAIKGGGTLKVKATMAGGTNYNDVSTAEYTITINKKELSLAKTSVTGKIVDGETGIDLSTQGLVADPEGLKTLAEASATLTFAVDGADNNASATISDNKTVKWSTELNEQKTSKINVTMADNDYYTLASGSKVTLTVTAKTAQTISFGEVPTTKTYGDASFTVTASGGAGEGAITYSSSDTAVATVNASTGEVTILKPGSFTITATKAEDDTYAGATATTDSITVNKKALTATAKANKTYDGDDDMDVSELLSDVVFTGLVDGDADKVSLSAITADYATKDAHSDGRTATVSSVTLGGDKSDYYTLAANGLTITGTIDKLALTIGATVALTKTYDGGTDLTSDNETSLESATLTGKVTGDDVKLAKGTLAYSKAGQHEAANMTGTPVLAGEAKDNYTLSYTAGNVTGAVTRVTGLSAELKATASISGTGVKLSDLVTMTGMVNDENADALVGSDWTYSEGVYTNTAGTIKATFYVKSGESYEKVTGALEAGKTYYVDVQLTARDYGNYTVSTGLTEKNQAPENDDSVTGNYCVLTIEAAPSGGGGIPVEKPKHQRYMQGYPGGSFLPDGSLTRAEAAAMLARLSEDFKENTAYPNPFTDVPAGEWYANYVGFAASKGLITGYEDDSFRGDSNITRGEFAAMIARFVGLAPAADMTGYPFTDGQGHWAQGYILALHKAGMIAGYEDDSFRPDASISRAEAAKLVNAALGRVPSPELVDKAVTEAVYTDVAPGSWYYYDVMEASITHDISDYHK